MPSTTTAVVVPRASRTPASAPVASFDVFCDQSLPP